MTPPRERPRFRFAPLAPAAAALVVALALLWTLLPQLFEERAARQLLEALDVLAPTVAERLATPETRAERGAAPGFDGLQRWATSVGAAGPLRLSVIGSDGRVVADSAQTASDLVEMENHAARPEIAEALARGKGTAVRESATTGRPYVYAARSIQSTGGRVFVVRLAQPLSEVVALRGHLARAFGLALGAALLAAIAVFWQTDRRFHRPLAELIEGARELAGGRYGERLAVPEDGQLAALARALNGLSGAVESQLAATQSERDHLSSILASMSEGVLVVDASGRAVLANGAFGRLFDVSTEVAGRSLLEILRRPEVERLVAETLERGQGRTLTLDLEAPERRTLVIASDVLASAGGARVGANGTGSVVVVRDATEQTRLDEIRRDFVANVSHELKTPLAAIRGYAETLRDGALEEPTTAARFTNRILDQCRRLQALLDDLLTLSRLEGVAREAPRQSLDLVEIAREAIEWVAPAAAAREVKVTLDSPQSLEFAGDGEGLLRMLVNLLANAITYNRVGGSVEVRLRDGGDLVWIEVADTGIGIPPEALPRLFERFYRVDKGRAREDGGTGLGLAIVKHVAQSHGGGVEVESRLGQGSTFRVKVPRG